MILIADSGSTKTHWCLAENGKALKEIFTDGINPFYENETEIARILKTQLTPDIISGNINSIFFYGAGCSFPDKKGTVRKALEVVFPQTISIIESDLLGATRSLLQHRPGIACILGTGSNSCFYNGNEMVSNVSPLGFVLGDEGSGAVLGRQLVADCLKSQLPASLIQKFYQHFNITPQQIMENVYKKPFPNRFLASLVPFLAENKHDPDIYRLISNSFRLFFERNIRQYPITGDMPVCFVGSVAHHFEDILRETAAQQGINISKIVQSPMSGLIEYHLN